jgi:DNA-directed RNA polymerase subunit H (RpoH/RPB5)
MSTNIKYKCLLTILQMLQARNYDVFEDEDEKDNKTYEDSNPIDRMLKRKIVVKARSKENPDVHLGVIFPPEIKLGVAVAREYIKHLQDNLFQECIIVTEEGITTFALPHLHAVSDIKFQVFTYLQLENNITHHHLFPEHRKITDPKERAEFFKTYKVDPSKMPQYALTDPVVKFLGYKEGDLICVYRKWGNQIVRYYKIVADI